MAAGKTGKQPVRTCLGCRQPRQRGLLWRFALEPGGRLLLDEKGRQAGRHAYCCKNRSCLEKFLGNRKGLARAFRSQMVGIDEGLHDLFGSGE